MIIVFIICAEILAIIVRNNEAIKGINIDGGTKMGIIFINDLIDEYGNF